jgi:hypothetical protein
VKGGKVQTIAASALSSVIDGPEQGLSVWGEIKLRNQSGGLSVGSDDCDTLQAVLTSHNHHIEVDRPPIGNQGIITYIGFKFQLRYPLAELSPKTSFAEDLSTFLADLEQYDPLTHFVYVLLSTTTINTDSVYRAMNTVSRFDTVLSALFTPRRNSKPTPPTSSEAKTDSARRPSDQQDQLSRLPTIPRPRYGKGRRRAKPTTSSIKLPSPSTPLLLRIVLAFWSILLSFWTSLVGETKADKGW